MLSLGLDMGGAILNQTNKNENEKNSVTHLGDWILTKNLGEKMTWKNC